MTLTVLSLLLDKVGITGDTAKDISEEITEDLYDEVSSVLDDDDDWDDDDFDWDDDDDLKITTSAANGSAKTTTTDVYDDDDMYNFDDFDWDGLKYEDYKDFMSEEEFKEYVEEMKEFAEEHKKAS